MSLGRSRAGALLLVISFVVVALLAGCGGKTSTVGSAESLTKKAMKANGTTYTSIECMQPGQTSYVCEALGSATTPGLYAWCSVPLSNGGIGDFDPETNCHFSQVVTAPKNTTPNNPILTTPSRLG